MYIYVYIYIYIVVSRGRIVVYQHMYMYIDICIYEYLGNHQETELSSQCATSPIHAPYEQCVMSHMMTESCHATDTTTLRGRYESAQ